MRGKELTSGSSKRINVKIPANGFQRVKWNDIIFHRRVRAVGGNSEVMPRRHGAHIRVGIIRDGCVSHRDAMGPIRLVPVSEITDGVEKPERKPNEKRSRTKVNFVRGGISFTSTELLCGR